MKKLLAILVSFVLFFALAIPAYAASTGAVGGSGAIALEKVVRTENGNVNIKSWLDANNFRAEDLIKGFSLYAVDSDGAPIVGNPILTVGLGNDGWIRFSGLADGWYAVVEVLTDAGKAVFNQPGVEYLLLVNGIQYGASLSFDYDANYTIYNGYGGGYILGYPGLNNTGDIFPIAVISTTTGSRLASFCANAGSISFFEGEGNYMVALRMDRESSEYADFVAAYNYIEANWGNLDDLRPITQIITWYLLGAIEIPSADFDNIDWVAVAAGGTFVKGVENAKAIVKDVVANYKSFKGEGKIVDVVFMVGKDNADYYTAQPQLVPIYGKAGIINTLREDNYSSFVRFSKSILTAYGSRAATDTDGAFKFALYQIIGKDRILVNNYFSVNGEISVNNLLPGNYVFVEVLSGNWKPVNYTDGLFFTIDETGSVTWTDKSGKDLGLSDNPTLVNGHWFSASGSITGGYSSEGSFARAAQAHNLETGRLGAKNGNWFQYVVYDMSEGGVQTFDLVQGDKLTKVGTFTVEYKDGAFIIRLSGELTTVKSAGLSISNGFAKDIKNANDAKKQGVENKIWTTAPGQQMFTFTGNSKTYTIDASSWTEAFIYLHLDGIQGFVYAE